MANLAIRGHKTRGKEVIEILEMLGGKSYTGLAYKGEDPDRYYCIDKETNFINASLVPKGFQVFPLEEFLEKFPYKVGDKVNVKETGKDVTIEGMSWRNGCEVIYDTCYKNDCVAFYSAEELQPYKEETMESKPNILQQLKEYFDNTPREVIEKEWHEYDKYNKIGPTVNEYLEYVNKSRQSQYPKTYEECCDVLGRTFPINDDVEGYKWELIMNFQRLLVCRDAYWKISGEQMGLGKPWKPDWRNSNEDKYCIEYSYERINSVTTNTYNCIFAFPTAGMRDVFYENFKDLIIKCVELL